MNLPSLFGVTKKEFLYIYRDYVSKIYDGNTITVSSELGFNAVLKGEKLRLFDIKFILLRFLN